MDSEDKAEAIPTKDRRAGRISWEAITAVAAVLIAFAATLVSAYTAWEQHQQTRAQVWPHLLVATYGTLPNDTVENGSLNSHGGGLVAVSSGVGPAIVSRVEVLVNGKPQREWSDVFRALGYKPSELHAPQSILSGNVLAPGTKMYWLMVIGQPAWKAFARKAADEVVIRVCYRSALRDYWVTTEKSGGLWANEPVASCASIPRENAFND